MSAEETKGSSGPGGPVQPGQPVQPVQRDRQHDVPRGLGGAAMTPGMPAGTGAAEGGTGVGPGSGPGGPTLEKSGTGAVTLEKTARAATPVPGDAPEPAAATSAPSAVAATVWDTPLTARAEPNAPIVPDAGAVAPGAMPSAVPPAMPPVTPPVMPAGMPSAGPLPAAAPPPQPVPEPARAPEPAAAPGAYDVPAIYDAQAAYGAGAPHATVAPHAATAPHTTAPPAPMPPLPTTPPPSTAAAPSTAPPPSAPVHTPAPVRRSQSTRLLRSQPTPVSVPLLPPELDALRSKPRHGESVAQRAGRAVRRAIASSPAAETAAVTQTAHAIQQPVATGRQISVTSIRGGAGKSTVAALLALTYAHYRADPVLAIEADPALGTLPHRLGAREVRWSGTDLAQIVDPSMLITDLTGYLIPFPGGGWLLPGSQGAIGTRLDVDTYRVVMTSLRRYFATTVVDCETLPAEVARTALVTTQARVLVSPATPEGVAATRSVLDWAGGLHPGVLPTTVVVLSHVSPDSGLDLRKATEHLGVGGATVLPLPYDRHLAAGGAIRTELLGERTLQAAARIAAEAMNRAVSRGPGRQRTGGSAPAAPDGAPSGPVHAGPAYPGPAYPGPAHAGPAHDGPVHPGPVHHGPVHSGPAHPHAGPPSR